METIIDLLQAFHLNMLEVLITGMFLFGFGYQYGRKKVKKLTREISHLQRDILDLNAELLFGKEESTSTPVIEIKHEALKSSKMAK
jgi:hypothetical protein